MAEFLTRPQFISNTKRQLHQKQFNTNQPSVSILSQHTRGCAEDGNQNQVDSMELGAIQSCREEKHLVVVMYSYLGELPAFLFGWVDLLINITAVSACR